jgi:CheY-like chemotaxis protein
LNSRFVLFQTSPYDLRTDSYNFSAIANAKAVAYNACYNACVKFFVNAAAISFTGSRTRENVRLPEVSVKRETAVLQIRILIVEDHKSFLHFVSSTLRQLENVQVVGEVHDGLEAVQRAQELQPDLIVLDIGLPSLNGIEAAYRIRTVAPDARILFLSQESSAEVVQEAFALGAWGYVIKTQAAKELPVAIGNVSQGTKFASQGLDLPPA